MLGAIKITLPKAMVQCTQAGGYWNAATQTCVASQAMSASGSMSFLTDKTVGLPNWAWGLLGVGVLGGAYYYLS